MENNIELFDKYILGELSAEEKAAFEARLMTDSSFTEDFRIFLLAVRGIQKEQEQDDMEFGHAMKEISKEDLCRIIGRKQKKRFLRIPYLRERLAWASSVAAILIVGVVSIFQINRTNQHKLDNVLVEYNYVYASKDGDDVADITEMSEKQLEEILPQLKKEYDETSTDDLQAFEANGIRLAMAYLKLHDRKQAKAVLSELASKFADDEEFAAQCKRIISLIE